MATRYPISNDQLQDVMAADKEYTEKLVSEKFTKLGDDLNALNGKLNDEIVRAQRAEQALDDQYLSEVDRVNAVTSKLGESITAETGRATDAEKEITSALDAEIQRATAAEASLDEKIENLPSFDPIKEELEIKISDVETNLTAEVNRSTAADDAIKTRIDQVETSTASSLSALETAVESNRVGIADEIARATKAEEENAAKSERLEERINGIDTRINGLVSDVDGEINSLDNKITAETNRSIAEEEKLSTGLQDEVRRATSAEEEIRSTLTTSIGTISGNITEITTKLNDEIVRAQRAEQALDDQYLSEVDRATAAEKALSDRIDAGQSGSSESITELENRINAELASLQTTVTNNDTATKAELQKLADADQTITSTVSELSAETASSIADLNTKIETEAANNTNAINDAKAALTEQIDAEKSIRETQVGEITTNLDTMNTKFTASISGLTDKMTAQEAVSSSHDTKIDTLEKSTVTAFSVNTLADAKKYAYAFKNLLGTVVFTIPIAYDPNDPAQLPTDIANKMYVDSAIESVRDSATADVSELRSMVDTMSSTIGNLETNLQAEVSRATSAEEALSVKVDDSIAALRQIIDANTAAIAEINDTKLLALSTGIDTINNTKIPEIYSELSETDNAISSINTAIDEINETKLPDINAKITEIVETKIPDVESAVAAVDNKVGELSEQLSTTVLISSVITPMANLHDASAGREALYGNTWKITNKYLDLQTGEVTVEENEFDMFKQSGAFNVQDELYDEIGRSKVEDDRIDLELTTEINRSTAADTELSARITAVETAITDLTQLVNTLKSTSDQHASDIRDNDEDITTILNEITEIKSDIEALKNPPSTL